MPHYMTGIMRYGLSHFGAPYDLKIALIAA
jgi:hypothetical protein